MTITEQKVRVPVRGLEAPCTVCHITDSHVSQCDGRDDETYNAHARVRDGMFSNGHPGALKAALMEMVGRADDADGVIFTGDIIDFPSRANLDALSEALTAVKPPCLYVYGNHDDSAPWEEAERHRENRHMFAGLPGLQAPADYARMDINGLRFIALDNSDYQISPEHAAALERDLMDGLPTVLCLHIPFYAPTLYEPTYNFWLTPCLTGVPEDMLPERDRAELAMDGDTRRALDMLRNSPSLRCVLAGHLHFTHDDVLWGDVRQYTCANGAMGFMRRVEFVPEV